MSYGNKHHVLDRISVAEDDSPILIMRAHHDPIHGKMYECMFAATVKSAALLKRGHERLLGVATKRTRAETVARMLRDD